MALGTVLTRRWQPPVGPLTVTAWQLSAGGLLLMPLAFLLEPMPFRMDADALLGMAYLAVIGAALTYLLWFRGIRRLGPNLVAPLGFLSPVAAILLGWVVLGQQLTLLQIVGIATILTSILWGGRVERLK